MEIPSPHDKAKGQEQGFGPVMGIIIIVTLIAAAGIYILVTKEIQRQITPPAGQEQAHL